MRIYLKNTKGMKEPINTFYVTPGAPEVRDVTTISSFLK